MKKKRGFLAILLCICMLLVAGCFDGGLNDFGGDDSFGEVLSMDGVKVLSKPTDYDFSGAVGENNSVNYYNEFARHVLFGLYNIYENPGLSTTMEYAEDYFKDITREENVYTFNNDMADTEDLKKYYLYDSLRYTIRDVKQTFDGDLLNEIQITLKTNAWEWAIPFDAKFAEKKNIVFEQLFSQELKNNELIYNFSSYNVDMTGFPNNWTDIYTAQTKSTAFPEFYYFGDTATGDTNSSYFTSPYYQESVEGASVVTAQNFFQDALEYATYLFVLGYDYVDYVDTDGTTKNDAPYFDFEIETVEDKNSPEYGKIIDIKVGGWENEKISVSFKQPDGGESALGRAKKLYNAHGNYVGLTTAEDENGVVKEGEEGNVQQIERFIKDKVIGAAAWGTGNEEGGKFEVKIFENGVQQTSLHFNRNYEQIVRNVVKYACTQAPIGGTEGSKVNLNKPYLASVITDFKGNYFEPQMTGDSLGTADTDEMFKHIDAAEYQSIVFMPSQEDFDLSKEENTKMLLDTVTLYFEYWDETSKTAEESQPNASGRKHAPSITINVGFRYFDHEVGDYTAQAECPVTIDFEQFPRYEDYGRLSSQYTEAYGRHTLSFSDTTTGGCISFGNEVEIKTTFTSPPEIDAFANSNNIVEGTDDKVARMRIDGGTDAKDFYNLNKSSSYGFFGTLNKEKFAGPNGCDFVEVYFDVVKQKGMAGAEVDYSFKVCVDFLTMRESQKIYG